MLDDVRTACRRLLRAPGFALAAIGIIAFAIGANTAIFAVADAVLFRPLPYDHPENIYIVRPADPRQQSVPIEYVEALAAHRGIAALAMRGLQSIGSTEGPDAEWLSSIAVTVRYLRVLGVRPARGRVFVDADTRDWERVVMLSYDCWQRHFGGDPHIVGRSLTIGSRSKEIVGVLPAGFVFPAAFGQAPSRFGQLNWPDYLTVAREPVLTGDPKSLRPIATGGLVQDPVVRLKPGVTRERAQDELDALIARLRGPMTVSSAYNPRFKISKPVLEDVRSVVFPTGRRIMTLLVAAAGLVLLLGCANLAIMLLVRTKRAEPQFGIQLALGATRGRIVRPVLIEAIVIGIAGGLVGLILAWATSGALLGQVPRVAYGSASVGVDVRTMLFALCLGLASGVVFGVLPAWRATRLDVQALLQGRVEVASGTRHRLLARPLVGTQVALAIVLLFGAVIAGRTLVSVLRMPLGFDPQNVASFYMDPPWDRGASAVDFYERALEGLRRRPGVLSAGAAYSLPLGTNRPFTSSDDHRVVVDWLLPGYLETIHASLLRGRLPTRDDLRARAKVAVVSESAARALFPGAEPLGRTFRLARGGEVTIIGIVGDVRRTMEDKDPFAVLPVAWTLLDDETAQMMLVARVRARSPRVLEDMHTELGRFSRGEPVVAGWWADSIDALAPFRTPRFQTLVLGTFAALALALTALGIFAVVSFAVTTRAREMGVRMALGASPRSLASLMVGQALLPVGVGAVLALIASRWVNAVVASRLFGVETGGPVLLVSTVAIVLVAAGVAAYLPARQTSRVNPADVLRSP